MKNQISLFSLLLLSLAAHSPIAQADGREGHGATVYDCNRSVEISDFKNTVILADFALPELFEGLRGKIVIPHSKEKVNAQILASLLRVKSIDEDLYARLKADIFRIKTNAIDPKTYYWGLTHDLGSLPFPKPENACIQKNAIYYYTDTDIEKNDDLLKRLKNNTQRAGSWVHEGVYDFTRRYGNQTDATIARLITALLFSEHQYPELLAHLVKGYLVADYNDPAPNTSVYLDPTLASAPQTLVLPSCLLQKYADKVARPANDASYPVMSYETQFEMREDLLVSQAFTYQPTSGSKNELAFQARNYFRMNLFDSGEIHYLVQAKNELYFHWLSGRDADQAHPECFPRFLIGNQVVASGFEFDFRFAFTGEAGKIKDQAAAQKAFDDRPARQRADPSVLRLLENKIEE